MKHYVGTTLFVAACLPFCLAAGGEPPPEEMEQNRRTLERIAAHPERFEQLRSQAKAFVKLPADHREKILRLEHDLKQQPSATQARLEDVLDRFAKWFEKLPEAEKYKVTNAPDGKARLEIIRELRDQEWLKAQPRGVQETLARQSPIARRAEIKKLRVEERRRHQEWQFAQRFWKELTEKQPLPVRLADFPGEVQVFVHEYLLPRLSGADKDRLENAERQPWPRYAQTLVELADRNPPALAGAAGPTSVAELPAEVRNRLARSKPSPFKLMKLTEGRWPDFAVALTDLASKRGIALPYELWPTHFKSLAPAMQEFVVRKLEPALEGEEKLRLARAEGRWPDYPQAIHALSRRQYLHPPWFTLPGSKRAWENYRLQKQPLIQGFPEISKARLEDFALYELGTKERPEITPDAAAWRRLTEAYFRHYPAEHKRLVEIDQKWRDR